MTEADFRDSEHRQVLRELLSSDSFQIARSIVLEKMVGADVVLDAPEIASARLLSQRAGYELAFTDLQALTQTAKELPREPESDFGEPEAAAKLNP